MLDRFIPWLIEVQLRFILWEFKVWRKFSLVPKVLRETEEIISGVSAKMADKPLSRAEGTQEMSLEMRIAISRLVVQRRRGQR